MNETRRAIRDLRESFELDLAIAKEEMQGRISKLRRRVSTLESEIYLIKASEDLGGF